MSDFEVYTLKGLIVARVVVWYFLGLVVVPFLGAYLTKVAWEFFFEKKLKDPPPIAKTPPPSSKGWYEIYNKSNDRVATLRANNALEALQAYAKSGGISYDNLASRGYHAKSIPQPTSPPPPPPKYGNVPINTHFAANLMPPIDYCRSVLGYTEEQIQNLKDRGLL